MELLVSSTAFMHDDTEIMSDMTVIKTIHACYLQRRFLVFPHTQNTLLVTDPDSPDIMGVFLLVKGIFSDSNNIFFLI